MTQDQLQRLSDDLADIIVGFAFEQNDKTTRANIYSSVLNYLAEQVDIFDYGVVCDETNNSSVAELHVDVCIKFSEDGIFHYFPMRLTFVEVNANVVS